MKKLVFVFFAILALNSCSSYFSNRNSSYLNSRNGATLEVPKPLTSGNIGHFYDLPPQTQNPRVSIAPPVENS